MNLRRLFRALVDFMEILGPESLLWPYLITGKFKRAFFLIGSQILLARVTMIFDQAQSAYMVESSEEVSRLYALAAEKCEAASRISPDMPEALCAWGCILYLHAESANKDESERLRSLAAERFEAALRIKPGWCEALHVWGRLLASQARFHEKGAEADRIFTLAEQKFEAALRAKPNMHEALLSWASALKEHGQAKTEAERPGNIAEERFEKLLRDRPELRDPLQILRVRSVGSSQTKEVSEEERDAAFRLSFESDRLWDSILSEVIAEQANVVKGVDTDRLYALAAEKYEAALQLKPKAIEALSFWALLCICQGDTKTGAEADHFYMLAEEKCAAALRIKPRDVKALIFWCHALESQAQNNSGAEARRLYTLAIEKTKTFLAFYPRSNVRTLDSLGRSILADAKKNTGAEAEALYLMAIPLLLEGMSQSPGYVAYELAQVASLRGNADECRDWLRICEEHEDRMLTRLEYDTDFDAVRDLDWFKALALKHELKSHMTST